MTNSRPGNAPVRPLWRLASAVLLVVAPAGFAAEPLDAHESSAVQAGQLVRRVRDVKGEVWPEVTFFAVLPGAPEQHLQTYADFAGHTRFVPGLLTSEATVADGATQVRTVMKMPWPLENAVCTTRVSVQRDGDERAIVYAFVSGNHMKNMHGAARFSPWPGGKTLFTYTTHTTPRSPLAGLWRARVPGEVELAVKATVTFLTNEASRARLAQAQ